MYIYIRKIYLPGTLKNVPLLFHLSYWPIFERKSWGILADFAGSKFQRMASWRSFDFYIETE